MDGLLRQAGALRKSARPLMEANSVVRLAVREHSSRVAERVLISVFSVHRVD